MNEEGLVLSEVKELQKGITDILVAIGKIETEMRQVSSMAQKLDSTEKSVVRLETNLSAAFRRIDAQQEQIDDLEDAIAADKKAAKDDRKWLWGFIPAAATLIWKLLDSITKGTV